MLLRLLAPLLLAVLGGCASTPTIREIQSPVPVSARFERPVSVQLLPVTPGSARNYFFFPLAPNIVAGNTLGLPQHFYNLRYQEEFATLLGTELVRKGVASATVSAPTSPGLDITVAFIRATFNPNANQYFLDVAVRVLGHRHGYMKRYQVQSTEGDNGLQLLFFRDANSSRVKVSATLLNHLLRDLDMFLAGTMPKDAVEPDSSRHAQPNRQPV